MNFPYEKEPRKPKIKVTHAEPALVKFELTGTDSSVANALRRIMMAEVPTMAIEYVNIIENDSVLFDEFLAHRMGLLPLTSHYVGDIPPDFTTGRGFKEYKDCNCFDGCGYCTAQFELDVTNTEDKVLTVTHYDIVESKKYTRDNWSEEGDQTVAFPHPKHSRGGRQERKRGHHLQVEEGSATSHDLPGA